MPLIEWQCEAKSTQDAKEAIREVIQNMGCLCGGSIHLDEFSVRVRKSMSGIEQPQKMSIRISIRSFQNRVDAG